MLTNQQRTFFDTLSDQGLNLEKTGRGYDVRARRDG
jgi:hypothetical protein